MSAKVAAGEGWLLQKLSNAGIFETWQVSFFRYEEAAAKIKIHAQRRIQAQCTPYKYRTITQVLMQIFLLV